MAGVSEQYVCDACGKPLGADSRRDSAGNRLCRECTQELRAAAIVEPPPALSGPAVPVPPPVAPRPNYARDDETTSRWSDFWSFRWMITPYLVRGAFVLATIVCVLAGIMIIYDALDAPRMFRNIQIFQGIMLILFGPVVYRVIAECLVVVFRIHAALENIDRKIGEG